MNKSEGYRWQLLDLDEGKYRLISFRDGHIPTCFRLRCHFEHYRGRQPEFA